MTTMHFLSRLQAYLKENGTIFTVRRFKYKPEVNVVFIPGVGACRRKLVAEDISKGALEPYYPFSGFETLDEWWNKIVEINPKLSPLYLYKVEVYRRL